MLYNNLFKNSYRIKLSIICIITLAFFINKDICFCSNAYNYSVIESSSEIDNFSWKSSRCPCGFKNILSSITQRFASSNLKHSDLFLIDEIINIKALPNELIYHIGQHLDLHSIIKLSHTSVKFKIFFDNDFWKKYNLQNNYQNFNYKISFLSIFNFNYDKNHALKVTLANYYFNKGKRYGNNNLIKKASFLGLTKAKLYLESYMNVYNNTENKDDYYLQYNNPFEEKYKRFN